ncbi:hypothetical protein NC651_005146 [Populus alba x Populus x berolinensis]|nr:hypothetical protein NC651_005146 [Populus alba x Populus x berolinensis]
MSHWISIYLRLTVGNLWEVWMRGLGGDGNYMRFPVRGGTFFEDEPFERNLSLKP